MNDETMRPGASGNAGKPIKDKPSNYERMQESARLIFCACDRDELVQKLEGRVSSAAGKLHATMLGRRYEISLEDGGILEWDDRSGAWKPAGPTEALSLYDLLCYSKPGAKANNDYIGLRESAGASLSGYLGAAGEAKRASMIARDREGFVRACKTFGGIRYPIGDEAYSFEVFAGLSMVLQFWDGDEEFDPTLRVLWDTSARDFLHYETMHYLAGLMTARLLAAMDARGDRGGEGEGK